ncbi:MAG: EamA family transporter [Anaerolineales bacterium]
MTYLELAPIAFGILSAATWGAGDFSGGLASKRAGVLSVIIGSQLVGMLLLIGLALAFDTAMPWASDLGWGAGAGLAGAIGLFALYRGLASGRMGLVAPLSAVLAAALPVIVGSITQGLPDGLQFLGFGFALAGVWLLSRPEGALSFRLKDLTLPVVAGLGFGLFFVLMDRANDHAIFWPIVAARVASLGLMSGIALFNRQPMWPARTHWPLTVLAGVLDAGGNAFFTLAAQAGRLDVASVLSSLYPASTVALAWVVLKERLTRPQWVGVAATLVAIVLIAL